MNNPVSCGKCKFFISPDPKYESNSIGDCNIYREWVRKWEGRYIPVQTDNRVNAELGNKIFFTDVERYCIKFGAK
jgi:hypothetical protein